MKPTDPRTKIIATANAVNHGHERDISVLDDAEIDGALADRICKSITALSESIEHGIEYIDFVHGLSGPQINITCPSNSLTMVEMRCEEARLQPMVPTLLDRVYVEDRFKRVTLTVRLIELGDGATNQYPYGAVG